jgi:hypothetical protein
MLVILIILIVLVILIIQRRPTCCLVRPGVSLINQQRVDGEIYLLLVEIILHVTIIFYYNVYCVVHSSGPRTAL